MAPPFLRSRERLAAGCGRPGDVGGQPGEVRRGLVAGDPVAAWELLLAA